MRKRLTYANVAATMALVFSMSGGALAANHYLINSTKQINPKVLKKLTGKVGPRGPAGTNGINGSNGTNGTNGLVGGVGPAGPGVRWVLVNKSGAIIEQSGGISLEENGNGGTIVDFGTDVTHRPIIVSGAYTEEDPSPRAAPYAQDCTSCGEANADKVFLVTPNLNGGFGPTAYHAFYLAVLGQ